MCDHMTLLLTLWLYYMTFYHKNTCTLWITIIGDNYFKFNLKLNLSLRTKKKKKKQSVNYNYDFIMYL